MSSKRPRIPGMAPGWTVGSIAALGALLGLLASPAEADRRTVYASYYNNEDHGVVTLNTSAPHDLRIWLYSGGTATSLDPCHEGQSGDEICGYHLQFEIKGSGCFETFTPFDPNSVHYPPGDELDCTTRELGVTLVDTGPTSADPVEIGMLTVNAAVATSVEVTGRQFVTAGLALEDIPPDTIAYVPEPAEILLLASGIAGLAGLRWLRRGSPRAG